MLQIQTINQQRTYSAKVIVAALIKNGIGVRHTSYVANSLKKIGLTPTEYFHSGRAFMFTLLGVEKIVAYFAKNQSRTERRRIVDEIHLLSQEQANQIIERYLESVRNKTRQRDEVVTQNKGKRVCRRYSEKVKREAVRFMQNNSIYKAEKKYGISNSTLWGWKHNAEKTAPNTPINFAAHWDKKAKNNVLAISTKPKYELDETIQHAVRTVHNVVFNTSEDAKIREVIASSIMTSLDKEFVDIRKE